MTEYLYIIEKRRLVRKKGVTPFYKDTIISEHNKLTDANMALCYAYKEWRRSGPKFGDIISLMSIVKENGLTMSCRALQTFEVEITELKSDLNRNKYSKYIDGVQINKEA